MPRGSLIELNYLSKEGSRAATLGSLGAGWLKCNQAISWPRFKPYLGPY